MKNLSYSICAYVYDVSQWVVCIHCQMESYMWTACGYHAIFCFMKNLTWTKVHVPNIFAMPDFMSLVKQSFHCHRLPFAHSLLWFLSCNKHPSLHGNGASRFPNQTTWHHNLCYIDRQDLRAYAQTWVIQKTSLVKEQSWVKLYFFQEWKNAIKPKRNMSAESFSVSTYKLYIYTMC